MMITSDDPVSKGAQRFEVFTGAGKRREWPPEVKAAIVAECCSGREGVSSVARRHGLDPSQVYVWRKGLLRQVNDDKSAVPSTASDVAAFVPAVIEPGAVPDPAPVRRASRRRRRAVNAAVELEIDGVAVKIARSADAGVIAAVIEALKATR